ncbi:adhesion G protein-coupled receptor E3-like [Anneissia japonica]|uniref:adhesion G protein-coupled receptor E3-like n=1 Tax=Anneissia japonica TaxID=1529436 RepID=UPI001425B621|nr:adhesion G protein-coupled receptor E3-like [Anneissia japonica]
MSNATDFETHHLERCHIIDKSRGYDWEEDECSNDYCGMCKKQDCRHYETNDQYIYQYNLPRIQSFAYPPFEFSVKAQNDVHIALSAQDTDLDPLYEIVIGGWGNTKSTIRRCKLCKGLVYFQSSGFLDPNDYRRFWIQFVDGNIAVGYIGEVAFMTYNDPNPLDVNYVGYSTGWGSCGSFQFCGIGCNTLTTAETATSNTSRTTTMDGILGTASPVNFSESVSKVAEIAKSLQLKVVDLKMTLEQNKNRSIMSIVEDFENQLKTMAVKNDISANVDLEGLISAGFQKANCGDDLVFNVEVMEEDNPLSVNPTFSDCRNESIKITYTVFSEVFFSGLPGRAVLGPKKVGVAVKTSVVSFSIIPESNVQVDANIKFSIPHKQITEKVFCMFWDMYTMVWSDKGCQVTNASQTETSCVCNHTTSYSVLVQVTDDEVSSSNDVTLTLLSQVLLIISTVALILGVFILFCLRGLCDCVRTSIHKHLMITLVMSHMLFLTGIEKTSSKVGCTVIAATLLYLLLAVFMWMLAEAVFLYFKIFDIHGTSVRYRKISRYIVCCYGAPMVVVGVALACNVDGFGTDNACWLTPSNGHIWAFAGPALIICLANLALILKVAKTIYMRSKRHTTAQQKKEFAMIRKAVRGALILVPLLGVTWLFGIFAYNKGTTLFSYVFVIFNGSQGLAIFLVCIVLSPQVKDEMKKQTWMRCFLKVNSVGSEQVSHSHTTTF